MGQTIIRSASYTGGGLNGALAVKKQSTGLAVDFNRKGFFNKKFTETGESCKKPIMRKDEIESVNGSDAIGFDISMQLSMAPVTGNDSMEGKHEQLSFYSDTVYIDRMRGGVNTGNQMARKRTMHDLRKVGRDRSSDWWEKAVDQLIFIYLSGSRGTNTDYKFLTSFSGFANNSIVAPDSNHIVYGGTATSKATVTSTDVMSTLPIDRAVAYAEMMADGGPAYSAIPKIPKCSVEGFDGYVVVMDGYQKFNMRRNSTTNDWADIQKALVAVAGNKSEFFRGGLGVWNGCMLYEHSDCVRFTDYGAATNVNATRALLLGAQAGVIAYGSPGGDKMRFDWYEELVDSGGTMLITTTALLGVKKTIYNGNDYGVFAIDTASTRP